MRSVSGTRPLEIRKSTVDPASADVPPSGVVFITVSAGTEGEFSRVSAPGVSRLMNEPSRDSDSKFGVDPSIEWTALLNLLVKKGFLTRDEVRVEIELLKRNKTQF